MIATYRCKTRPTGRTKMYVDYYSVARTRRMSALNTLNQRKQELPGLPGSSLSLRASEAKVLARIQFSSRRSLVL